MPRLTRIILAALALSTFASAQSPLNAPRKAGQVKDAGIYHVATGTWTRHVSGAVNLGPDTIYTNNAPSSYFATFGLENDPPGSFVVDEGRVPGLGSNTPTADRNVYEINGLSFGYCTQTPGPNIDVEFSLYHSYLPCDLISLGNPTSVLAGTAAGTGLPGFVSNGMGNIHSCWVVTLDLEGVGEFCFEADGGPAAPGFDNDLNLDSFGIQWTFTNQAGMVTGPLIAGDPDWTEADAGSISGIGGSGTYYYTGPASCADTGLDTRDFVAVDGTTTIGPGCRFFGGYKNTNGCMTATNTPLASFHFSLFASAGECDPDSQKFCTPAGINSSGGPASISAIPTTPSATLAGIRLEASGGPTQLGSAFGFFLVSGANTASIPLGQGTLCLNGPQGRYSPASGSLLNSLGRFDSSGNFANLAGTSTTGFGFDLPIALPTPPGGNISAGSTWHFQLWHRDLNPGATVNLTDGISVTF